MILLRPFWLLALLPLGLGLVWALRRNRHAGGWERLMPPDMRSAMFALGSLTGFQPLWQRVLPWLALLPLVLGLAGPAVPRSDAPVLAQTDAVVIALDLSPSVAQGPGLSEAQVAAAGLLQGLAGRPIGLVLYGAEAYGAAAPTADTPTIETLVSVLEPDLLPGAGSRPAAAISLAGRMLEGLRRADLILISDGGGIDPQALAEADRLAAAGVRISALRIADVAEGAPRPPDTALDSITRGGGIVLPAREMDRLAIRLERAGGTRRDPALMALHYRDLGPLLAAFAALPLLVMLRRQR